MKKTKKNYFVIALVILVTMLVFSGCFAPYYDYHDAYHHRPYHHRTIPPPPRHQPAPRHHRPAPAPRPRHHGAVGQQKAKYSHQMSYRAEYTCYVGYVRPYDCQR